MRLLHDKIENAQTPTIKSDTYDEFPVLIFILTAAPILNE